MLRAWIQPDVMSKAMRERALSKSELGRMAGMDRTNIVSLLKRKRAAGPKMRRRICEALGLRPEVLFEFKNVPRGHGQVAP